MIPSQFYTLARFAGEGQGEGKETGRSFKEP